MRLCSFSLLGLALVASAFELSLDPAKRVVTVVPAGPAEVVRYTLNGKDPDFSAGVYLAPIELPEGGTVKAAAFEGNKLVGKVTTLPFSSSLPLFLNCQSCAPGAVCA